MKLPGLFDLTQSLGERILEGGEIADDDAQRAICEQRAAAERGTTLCFVLTGLGGDARSGLIASPRVVGSMAYRATRLSDTPYLRVSVQSEGKCTVKTALPSRDEHLRKTWLCSHPSKGKQVPRPLRGRLSQRSEFINANS